MGWLATILGFAVTIAAVLLFYRWAYEGALDLVGGSLGPETVSPTIKAVISMVMLIVFISLGQWVGRMVRDWINAGRRPAPRQRPTA